MADLYIMDRSEYILKRMVLLRNWEAPTISDARKNFGDDLAEKIFCNCDDSLKEDFGLEPPLKGPMGKDLWSSPSDLLIGKVCLKPPFTSKHIRALTHQGILKIGLKVEKLFWNQMEIEKSKELEEQERTLKLLCETAKREVIANTRNVMMNNFRSERLDIVTEMENIFKEELKKLEDEYVDKIKEKLEEQAVTLKKSYEALLEEERLKNNEIVSHNSSIDLDEIEKTLQTAFQTYLQKAQVHANFKIQVEQARCKEKLKSLRHELECKNLANLMYVMCMERKKCNYENSLVKTELAKEIHTLSDLLQDKDKEAEKLVTEKNDLQKNVDLRESALSKVITEFQKFIYFALKAEPKQAEYLLSGEKLLLLELANELSKASMPEGEDDDHERNYLWDRTPPRSDSTHESLRVKDGHNCLREPEIVESELSVKQFLPGFHYNDQLFVREDFRNMLSQGIKIDSNDMLWTKQVQDIQDQMELPCQPSALEESRELTKKAPTETKKSLISFQSSVHFSLKEKDRTSISSEDQDRRHRKTSLKTVEPEDILRTVDFGHVGTEERRKTLIGTRNSVELLKENILKRKSSLRLTTQSNEMDDVSVSEEKEISEEPKLMILTKDSVVQTKMKQILTSSTEYGMRVLKEEEVMDPKKNVSKLIAVTDSLEILKRKNSKTSNKNMLNDFPESKLSNSGEITFQELPSNIEDSISQPPSEAPRRVSIVFTGKSVIYSDQNEKDIKPQKLKPKPREKRKRTLPNKFIPRQIKKNKIVTEPIIKKQDDEPKFTEQIVMGDSKFKFYQQNEEQFSNERINSFLNIIKEHPNLIRLFTSVTR